MPETDQMQENTPEFTLDNGEKIGADFKEIENELPLVDSLGAAFDPDQHAVDADGIPKFKADGSFAKKRGRKKGQKAGEPPSYTKPKNDGAEGESVSVQFPPEALAALTVGGYFTAMRGICGDDYAAPIRQEFLTDDGKKVVFDEGELLLNSVAGILKKRNVKTAPPELLLVATMLYGFGARAVQPESSIKDRVFKKFATNGQKIKAWIKSRKNKKAESQEEIEENED